jgi:hypothetical protein
MESNSQSSRLWGFIVLSILLILLFFIPFWAISGFKSTSKWPAILRYGWIISIVIAIVIANNNIYGKD